MAAIPGWKANVFISSPPSIALTNDMLTDSGDHITYVDMVAGHQYLDPFTPIVVSTSADGGVTWTPITTGFQLQSIEARVKFAVAQSPTLQVRITSGNYLVLNFLAQAESVEWIGTTTMLASTAFTNPPSNWKTIVPNISDAAFKLSKFWSDGFFTQQITSGNLQVLKITPGQTATQRIVGYGYLKADGFKASISALTTQSLEFDVTGQPIITA